MIDDEPLNAAMLEAAAPIVAAARIHGPWPRVTSDEFLSSALVVRQAVLLTVGISRVHLGDPVRALLREVSDAVRAPLPYGRDWPDTDLWLDRDDRVHRGDGPYLNRPWRRLRRWIGARR